MNAIVSESEIDILFTKIRQKAAWESGDFGQVAKYIETIAEEFMARVELEPGMKVLDAACGTGNLAVIAARKGCATCGVDIASNLIAQARERAWEQSLPINYLEGDVEALPYPDASFDVVVSMFGVMFPPRPDVAVSELRRVTRPGGLIALANWTPEGFIGKMFSVFGRYLLPPAGLPSPLQWGSEKVVRERFDAPGEHLKFTRRLARMRFPFEPAGTVEFFRPLLRPDSEDVRGAEIRGKGRVVAGPDRASNGTQHRNPSERNRDAV